MVLLDAPPSSHNTLAIFDRLGITPEVRYRPTTFELARALVGRGMGYALLVQRPANDRTYEGKQVVVKEISEPVGDFRILLAWPKGTRLNRRAQAFVDFCQDHDRHRSTPPETATTDPCAQRTLDPAWIGEPSLIAASNRRSASTAASVTAADPTVTCWNTRPSSAGEDQVCERTVDDAQAGQSLTRGRSV